jgi:hypothetical protein
MSRLIAANVFLAAAEATHGVDHFRQERGVEALNTEVVIGGGLVWAVVLASLLLALRRHRLAPVLCGGIGASVATGVAASHFLPRWSAFSDPYAGLGLDWFSWFAGGLEVVAAAVLALAGLSEALQRRRVAPS